MSATVAIITRTKDRPLLLARAARSVASQTHTNYNWVVVNDGGDEVMARSVIKGCEVDRDRIQFLSNPASLGMEAASNLGIRASSSDYILIHDDDDTVHPEFLEATVAFLESASGQTYGGVATKIEYVSEEIRGDEIIVHDQRPFLDWVYSLDFAEMLAQNLITSNSFLYRRSLFDQIGGYNEDLPVLGDWFFNIEFLLHADIKILPRALSFYHHRDRGNQSQGEPNANSVIGGGDKHRENAARCRNALVRKYRRDSGVAAAIVSGYFAHVQRHPDELGGKAEGQSSGGYESVERDRAELDRLWVLSQLLANQPSLKWFRRGNQNPVDPDASLVDLARLAKERQTRLPPPIGFDEERYLRENADVAAEVSRGGFQCGFEHYALNGHLEGRDRPIR
ncbi:MAG: glycosyltransferase [Pseudomonadota bacterium]